MKSPDNQMQPLIDALKRLWFILIEFLVYVFKSGTGWFNRKSVNPLRLDTDHSSVIGQLDKKCSLIEKGQVEQDNQISELKRAVEDQSEILHRLEYKCQGHLENIAQSINNPAEEEETLSLSNREFFARKAKRLAITPSSTPDISASSAKEQRSPVYHSLTLPPPNVSLPVIDSIDEFVRLMREVGRSVKLKDYIDIPPAILTSIYQQQLRRRETKMSTSKRP